MSASAHYNPLGDLLVGLFQALADLHVAQNEIELLKAAAYDKEGCETGDWNVVIGQAQNAPIVLKRESGKEFTIEPVDPANRKSVEAANKVKQAYARVKLLNELKQKGYSNVKEQKMPDGSIRLVVQKWQ